MRAWISRMGRSESLLKPARLLSSLWACWQITWYGGGRCWCWAAPDFNCFQNPAKYQPRQPGWYQRTLGEMGRKCGNVANSWYEVLAANILLPRLGMSKKRSVYWLPAVRVDKVAELLVIWGLGARGLHRDVSTRLMSESYLNITGRTLVCKNSQCKRYHFCHFTQHSCSGWGRLLCSRLQVIFHSKLQRKHFKRHNRFLMFVLSEYSALTTTTR